VTFWDLLLFKCNSTKLLCLSLPSLQNNPLALSDLYLLNLAEPTPTWTPITPKGDIPKAREGHTLTWLASKNLFLLFGGSKDEDQLDFNDAFTFDPQTSTWTDITPVGSPPNPRLNHAAAACGDSVYIFGGFQDGLAQDDMYRLNFATNTWTLISNPESPKERCNHSMTTIGTKIYVFGGRSNSTTVLNDLHVFNTGGGNGLVECLGACLKSLSLPQKPNAGQ
jgi:N-acetylneuraminic acid mutarotase